jgi:hypothetical protein
MRRLALGFLVLALMCAAPEARSPQVRPPQADAVVRLLTDVETALSSNRPDDFRALCAPALSAADLKPIDQTFSRGTIVKATVRERARRQVAGGFEVLADVLVSRGRTGRISTWQLAVRPKADAPDRYEINAILEVAALDGLLQISLNTTKFYAVHNLTLQAPDLTLKMASGSAFVAEAPSGVTALVLLGRGDVHFAPPDTGEQGQLRVFSGSPVFDTQIDAAFIRVNPAEFGMRVAEHSLTLSQEPAADLSRAEQIFTDLAPRSFNIDLGDLTDERWSIEPSGGSLVVEFRSRKYQWLTYARSPGDAEDVSLFDRAHAHNISSYASEEKLATRGRFYSEDDDRTYDVERYTLDLSIDPTRSWLAGRGSMRVKIKKSTSSITFKLAQSLVVSSVSSPNFGRLLALRVSGQNNILVTLPTFVMEDTDLVFDVAYSGRLDPQNFDREALVVQGQTQTTGGPPQLPTPPPQDPTTMPLIEPERRYLYSNRSLWYPQGPVTDYATATMRLSVPSQYQIVASGSLLGAKVTEAKDEGGRGDVRTVRTVDYATDRPVRYLSCVISRFVPMSRQRFDVPALTAVSSSSMPLDRHGSAAPEPATPGVNVEVVATPLASSRNKQLIARVGDIVRTYAKLVGEAPYPDLTVAAFEDNLPGGHSPPYFAMVLQPLPSSPYSWGNDPVWQDGVYPNFLLAHEIAHQWWGQAVGWKNYHEQWLSEGLAQYFAVLYAGTDRGPDVVRNLITQMRQSAQQYNSQGPISLGYRLGHIQNEGRVFRALDYNKSAVVLHMLRRLIGDEAFFAGLKQYYQDWHYKKAGTDDLRQAFETATPIKLSRFFDRWILASDLPRIVVTTRPGASAQSLVVRIEQQGEVFDFPYTVSVQYADGRTEDITIPVTEQTTERTIELKGAVRRVDTKDELTLVTFAK